MKIFVSHASVDKPIVNDFVELLEGGIGIHPKNIFCASIKGQGIRPGVDFKSSIKRHLDEATTVIALISENFYNSPFCMCELGGTWIQGKDFIPILVPPLQLSDLKAVLEGLQALKIQEIEDLDELRDELAERLGIKPLPTPRWTTRRDRFLNNLEGTLKSLPSSPIVPRKKYEKAVEVAREYQQALKEAEERITRLENLIKNLKKLKDRKEVSKLEKENLNDIELFKKWIDDISNKLSEFDGITQEVIFSHLRNEDYFPNHTASKYTWNDAELPLQYKEIELNSGENGLKLNTNDPNIRELLNLLADFETWLTEEASEDFYEWYSREHGGFEPDLTNRNFWDKHLW
jgi:hypothetical protein